MYLTLAEKVDKAQDVLDNFFPKLKMTAFTDHHNALDVLCTIDYGSSIGLAPGEITESVIRIRILEMLKDLKRKIELNIQEIEE